ncbi:hypothetical protein [Plantactinospora sp. KLBMP9567]|uniref:hypothetical protein n=1 Tax=Plantactinospora sp. KLBMP9567 TaxID=3085900 RepID=UPI002981B751|nr:hypothetical protein [Plantactinospora sp. KLBMP9567]MDW5327785.1 hypothetical protein [Plantactinospora sp. KLBMP9567]
MPRRSSTDAGSGHTDGRGGTTGNRGYGVRAPGYGQRRTVREGGTVLAGLSGGPARLRRATVGGRLPRAERNV